MDEKTKQAIESIQNGTLATSINKNMRFSLTGIAVGWALGMVIGAMSGQNKFLFGITGAIAGGAIGKFTASKIK